MEARGVEQPVADATAARGASSNGARRRPHRHQPATQEQKVAVAIIAIVAAVAGAVASAHPTGISGLDLLYRALTGAVVVIAASRSRRWALIVGSALACAGAFSWALIPGIAALVISLGLVGQNRRDRVVGAVVGLLVVVTTFHLTMTAFVGSSALVGVIATGLILVSGYFNSRSQVRRWWRFAILVAGFFVLVAVVAVGILGASSISTLRDGVDSTRDGVDAAQVGHTPLAALRFHAAAADFDKVSGRANAWWMSIARAVPVLGQNLSVVQKASSSGHDLAEVASNVSAKVDYSKLQSPTGGIDVGLLESYRSPVLDAAETLNTADRHIQALTSVWNIGPIRSRLSTLQRKVHSYRNQAVLAALAVDRAPSLLGATAPRHYLILLGNPAELRDIGGHLGNWAELTVDRGQLTLDAVGQPADLSLPSNSDALANSSTYPPSLVEMKPLEFPQNWGADPDMSVVARLSAQLYKAKTGTSLDGVVYADPIAFADFLKLTGPVPIPGLAQQLTAQNAVQFLTSGQFSAYPTESDGDAALEELVRQVFQDVTHVELPGPREMGRTFHAAVAQGRLKMVSLHSGDELLLSRLGMDGHVFVPHRHDVIGIINRNANPSKIDAYLYRSTEVSATWNPSTGHVDETVAVTVRNDVPSTSLPAVVVGNQAGLPDGTNLTDVALLSEYELQSVELDGQQVGSQPQFDGRFWRYTVRVPIAPGGSDVVTYHLEGSLAPDRSYEFATIGQPILHQGPIHVHLQVVGLRPISGRGISVHNHTATITLQDGVDTEVSVATR